ARPLRRAAAHHQAAPAAGTRRLFPAGGLFGRQRPGRPRVLPLADHRARRRLDPAFAVLRNTATGPAPGAPVLRQERGHPRRGHYAAAAIVGIPCKTSESASSRAIPADTTRPATASTTAC